MDKENYYLPARQRTEEQLPPSFRLLFLIWAAVLFFLSLPIASNFSTNTKIFAFATPVLLSLLVVMTKPEQGFYLWAIGLTLLVTQTGFQLEFGRITTSGLELLILFLVLLLVFLRRQEKLFPNISLILPGWQAYLAFFLFSLAMLILSLINGDAPDYAIFQLKGFIIYPLMGYLFVIGVRSLKQMRPLVLIMIAWFIFIAARGIIEYQAGIVTSTEFDIFRSSGSYAPTNLYGITLAVVILITLALSFASQKTLVKFVGISASLFMLGGLLASASRTAVISLGVGLLVLFFTNRKRNILWIGIVLFMLFIFYLFPDLTINRIFQLSDSSTISRQYYLQSGLAALKQLWLMGGGWGKGYWLDPIYGLYPSGFIPWYHNDYLNMAVQIGIFGLLVYLVYWFLVVREGYLSLRLDAETEVRPYIQGFLAALVCLLTGALFEHVLWRPDMAGLVGWVLGMLLAAISIDRDQRKEAWEKQSLS